jgi:hypothetical protein
VHREIRPRDHEHNPIYLIREAKKFPEFYAAYTPIQYYNWLPRDRTGHRQLPFGAQKRKCPRSIYALRAGTPDLLVLRQLF